MGTLQDFGLKIGDKIKVLREHHIFDIGEVVTLIEDDGDGCPRVKSTSTTRGEESYFDLDTVGWERVPKQESDMSKEEALSQIDEIKAKLKHLETYVKGVDDKPVMVYIKKWDKRPWNWNARGEMDYLCGTVQEVLSVNTSGYINVKENCNDSYESWSIAVEDVVVVEGDISKFN